MGLTLTKITEDEQTITLGWDPPAGIGGYVFYAHAEAVSTGSPNLKDGSARKRVKFSKTSPGPPFQVAAVCRQGGILVLESGMYLEPDPEPEPGDTISALPSSKVTLSGGQIAAWFTGKSPTTQVRPGPASRDKQRCIAWGPGDLYEGKDTYIIWQCRLNKSYYGRGYDPHIIGGESFPPAGVSPTAIDFWGDERGMHINVEPAGSLKLLIMSTQEFDQKWRGKVLTLSMIWRMGRPGRVACWVDRETTPRFDRSGIDTCYAGQTAVSVWEGAYWNKGHYSQPVEVDLALCRIGRTPAECYADRPTVYSRESAGNDNGPGGVITAIPNIEVPDIRVWS